MDLELVPKDDKPDDKPETLAEEPAEQYTGPERRKRQRRQKVDRREMLRFEEKQDRRSGKERRRLLGLWKSRDF